MAKKTAIGIDLGARSVLQYFLLLFYFRSHKLSSGPDMQVFT